jgi:hypothetical protein
VQETERRRPSAASAKSTRRAVTLLALMTALAGLLLLGSSAVAEAGAASDYSKEAPLEKSQLQPGGNSDTEPGPERPGSEVPCGDCAPQCDNGFDDDGDHLYDYPADPGCTGYSDPEEWNPAPPPPPPLPPPPPPPPPQYEWMDFMVGFWTGEYEIDECGGPMLIPCSGGANIRCKIVVKKHQFRGGRFNIEYQNSVRYKMDFRVCYLPYGGGVTSVSWRHGDVDNDGTTFPWEFMGNDDGFPYHIRYAHRATFHYGFSSRECLATYLCSATHHGRIILTFYDTGLYGRTEKESWTIQ